MNIGNAVEQWMRDNIAYIGDEIPKPVAKDPRNKFVLFGWPQLLIDVASQELARKDAEILRLKEVEQAGLDAITRQQMTIVRLRAALERCRDLPHSIKWGNDGDCGIARELDRVCAEALEQR